MSQIKTIKLTRNTVLLPKYEVGINYYKLIVSPFSKTSNGKKIVCHPLFASSFITIKMLSKNKIS